MKRKTHTPEQIIKKLREADSMIAAGKTIGQVAQALEISAQTFHRWRNQFGGMKAEEPKRLDSAHDFWETPDPKQIQSLPFVASRALRVSDLARLSDLARPGGQHFSTDGDRNHEMPCNSSHRADDGLPVQSDSCPGDT